ncbi:DNA-binding transcriptional MerR regulator [Cricetibacter osteomyelitidis]|uniref:DNA-binding transcriptional MerR regulator n=1 Tax=Cricetibacter osteomyelitidis TaxID=1521931 RepID=A0A4R2TJ64_9PAST|nr:MerR family DNA-binding protein [Cricetibacter osteomyelitidis]TCP97318.1 DNA-binding transcriptional MerR regulator [Cricetibacter osteomyelitidis]
MTEKFNIKALTQRTGLSLETIRYYEKVGLIRSERAVNGYRLFDQAAVERLQFIKNCRSLGFSVAETQALVQLKQQPQNDCENANLLLAEHLSKIDDKIAQLQQIRAALSDLQDCEAHRISQCKVMKGLAEL